MRGCWGGGSQGEEGLYKLGFSKTSWDFSQEQSRYLYSTLGQTDMAVVLSSSWGSCCPKPALLPPDLRASVLNSLSRIVGPSTQAVSSAVSAGSRCRILSGGRTQSEGQSRERIGEGGS